MDEAVKERIDERWDAGDMAAVAALCDGVLAGDPDDEPALRLRGAARGNLGDSAGAIDDLSRSIELQPDDWWGWTARGAARAEAGQHAEALADLTRAIELEPDDAWTRGKRFQVVARRLGLLDLARQFFDGQEPAFDRMMPDFEHLIGGAGVQADEMQTVLDDLRRALELDPAVAMRFLLPGLTPPETETASTSKAVDEIRDVLDTIGWIRPHREGDLEAILAKAEDIVRAGGDDALPLLMTLAMPLTMRVTRGVPGAVEAQSALVGLALDEIDRRAAAGETDLEEIRQFFVELP